MILEWSDDALTDLDRFAQFLHDKYPALAHRVAQEIRTKAEILIAHPLLGRPLAGREEYRQVMLMVLNARNVFHYRFDGVRLVMLRVFHARELRE